MAVDPERWGWEPLKLPADRRLAGWEEIRPLEMPRGSVATITGTAETWLGTLFEGRETLVVQLRVEPPGQPAIDPAYHHGFRRRGAPDLSEIEGLAAYMDSVGQVEPERLIDHMSAVLAKAGEVTWSAPRGPKLPFWTANWSAQAAKFFRKAVADAGRPDTDIVPYHPELAVVAMQLAYRAGRLVRERELAEAYQADAERARRAAKSGGEGRGKQMQASAEAWKSECRAWAQQLIHEWKGPKPITKGELADRIRDLWEHRPFTGGPARPKTERHNPELLPPSRETLTDELIPEWKRQGLRGLR